MAKLTRQQQRDGSGNLSEKTVQILHSRLIKRWGGVAIVYRRHLTDSPAYQRNYEELDLALQQGITYLQGLQPQAALLDASGHINGLRCIERVNQAGVWSEVGQITLAARTILLATGAQPNIAYEYEHRGTFERAGHNYASHVWAEQGPKALQMANCKDPHLAVLTSYDVAKRRVSFIGDSHPAFHGSVVKAMASGKRATSTIQQVLNALEPVKLPCFTQANSDFIDHMRGQFTAQIIQREVLNDQFVWLRIQAPNAVAQYRCGQFVRVQKLLWHRRQLLETRLC